MVCPEIVNVLAKALVPELLADELDDFKVLLQSWPALCVAANAVNTSSPTSMLVASHKGQDSSEGRQQDGAGWAIGVGPSNVESQPNIGG